MLVPSTHRMMNCRCFKLRCIQILALIISITATWRPCALALGSADSAQSGKQSIHQAAANGDIAQVRRLLNANPGLINSGGDNLGNTPLHFATWKNRAAMAEFLISKGANVNAKNSLGNTPLHDAIHNSGVLVPIVLLRQGANIDERNNEGETPLILAAQTGRSELVRLLLANGADVDATRKNGATALTCALFDGRLEVAQLLLHAGADINEGRTLPELYTALHSAADLGKMDVLRFLLANGASMTIKSAGSSMPIHKAALNGRGDAVLALIAEGCDLNALADDGSTPLQVAAFYGQKTVVQYLTSIGANINVRNKLGRTARDEGIAGNHPEIVAVLDQYVAAVKQREAREAALKVSGLVVQRGYASWTDSKMQTREVYRADFAGPSVGAEWAITARSSSSDDHSNVHVSVTPKGNRHFLGELGNQTVSLTVPNLPPHNEITISVDLYIIRSWVGNYSNSGFNVWSLSIVGGQSLLTTNFNNSWDVVDPSMPVQSYPGEYPDFNPVRTGADENNTLGFTAAVFGHAPQNMDAVYKLRFTFSHSGHDVQFSFARSGFQHLTDESWGLANVKVAVGVAPVSTASAPKTVPARKSLSVHSVTTQHKAVTNGIGSRSVMRVKRTTKKSVKRSGTPLHPRKKPLTP